jgi:hypothetical protein
MKEVWIIDWTEYEFGQRPDGTSMHTSIEKANAFLDKNATGCSEQFWRGSEPRKIFVSEQKYSECVQHNGDMWATNTSWLKTGEFVA